jgi:O-acetylserine/cysteine efflux transporter
MEWFSVSFQIFYRSCIAILILWVFTLSAYGLRGVRTSFKSIKGLVPKLFVLALCNFAHQFFIVKGVYLILPGLVTIVEESTLFFAVMLAFIFIPGERSLIKHPMFIAGIVMSVIGMILTSLPELSGHAVGGGSVIGIISVLISAMAWAVFSLLIKLWLPDTPATITSSIIFTLVIPFFLVSLLLSGSSGILSPDVPVSAWIILTVSGVIGIGLGYAFFYNSLKGLGVTLTSSLSILMPVITAVLSFFVFGEVLSPLQLSGAAVLLVGSLFIVRTRISS